MNKPQISLVIPIFNEEDCLYELVLRCRSTCRKIDRPFEIILVDDGSTDRSRGIIEELCATYVEVTGVFLNRNYGQHAAVMAGFQQSSGEIVITLDGDLQNPPEEIPKLLELIDSGNDVVGGRQKQRKDSLFRRMASYLTNRGVQLATGVLMHDYGCMLRAYRQHVVKAMLACHERSTFIPILANGFAHRTAEVEVDHNSRTNGDSRYYLWKLISLQFDLLTSTSNFPLRLLSLIGVFLALSGIGFGLLLLIMRLVYGAPWAAEGVFTLFAILFILVGAQFVGMGLMGEYIGRIYNDVRARPRYFVESICRKNAGIASDNAES